MPCGSCVKHHHRETQLLHQAGGRGRGQLGAGEGVQEGDGAHLMTCMKLLASSMPGRESAKSVSSSLASPDSPAGQDREESAG